MSPRTPGVPETPAGGSRFPGAGLGTGAGLGVGADAARSAEITVPAPPHGVAGIQGADGAAVAGGVLGTAGTGVAGGTTVTRGPAGGAENGADARPPLTERLAAAFSAVVDTVRGAFVGDERTVRLSLCCLMAEGHLLVEDHPGVGKTTLAKALAHSLGLGFGRVQFTADLLPADVTGAMVLDRDSGRIVFRPGPVFTNILLADELNRASPKAQSALLESMEERQVSTDGVSHALPQPFMVIATQNPYDAAGTFPLPHSQRDRFLLRLSVGYPDRQAEDELLAGVRSRPAPESLDVVGSPEFLRAFSRAVLRAHTSPEVRGYVLDLVGETRAHPDLTVGASPRASLAVLRAASALAVSSGRDYVIPDDVKVVAEPALGHRVVVHPAAELAGVTPSSAIAEILSRLVVPVGRAR
ncbi:MAG TPA: MoxR family ATPase [Acidimicrobiales bacterium]|nr:MoxR family ATPase [Acidimicrobiales bacterium]